MLKGNVTRGTIEKINLKMTRDVVKFSHMMSGHEREDIIHMMKINRFKLDEEASDTAHLSFIGQVNERVYMVEILVAENSPQVVIRRNGEIVFNETVRSVDDVKIFLEERLYKYL